MNREEMIIKTKFSKKLNNFLQQEKILLKMKFIRGKIEKRKSQKN